MHQAEVLIQRGSNQAWVPFSVWCAQATLEEVVHADVLVHVLDISSPHVMHQRTAVLQVLRSLGILEERLQKNVVEAWNKVDLLDANAAQLGSQEEIRFWPGKSTPKANCMVSFI
jgi:50S ribosomal subunit-associated GTPase HflX